MEKQYAPNPRLDHGVVEAVEGSHVAGALARAQPPRRRHVASDAGLAAVAGAEGGLAGALRFGPEGWRNNTHNLYK